MKENSFTLIAKFWICAAFLLSAAFPASVNAQCTLTCNDLVQVSLDGDCSSEVLPDMILEGNGCPNGILQVQAKINGVWTPANGQGNFVATASNINQTLQVRVRDQVTGNFCQGNIHVEDKWAPQINCADITISCAITDYSPADLDALDIPGAYPTVIENCGTYTQTSIDTWNDLPCNGTINNLSNISAYVRRKWTVVDNSGNSATCTQYIYFQRRNVNQVSFPPNITVDCSNPNTDPSNTGVPFIAEYGQQFGIYPNNTYCELNAGYQDQTLPVCDGTYKILRTWTVLDWCLPTSSTNPRVYVQLIKVEDDEPPVVACPEDMTVGTNSNDCQSDFDLPDVIISDNCSQIESIYAQFEVNGNGVTLQGTLTSFPGNNLWNPDTLGVLGIANNFPIGVTTVTYVITDDCGNSTTCQFDVTVEDSTPPDVACDEFTQVALGASGMALINATTFDDGSYDNCSPVEFKVRRMDQNPCQDNSSFYDQVKFCCEDIGDTITVILRVYDVDVPTGAISLATAEEHSNECMVRVLVEDKLKPTCNPPANVTVNCENFDPSLWSYGTALAEDNCCIDTITTTASYTQFDTVCSKGTITRTFRAFDCGGLSSQCTQRIVVTYKQNYFVKFPDDRIITTCDGTGNYGAPTFFGEDCELLAVSYEDVVFTVVPDACFKIERLWTVINWCTYNPNGTCINVPNPNPNSIVNHPSNLPGPIVSPITTVGDPWRATVVKIDPSDPTTTSYTTFYDANANCYKYKQIIKVVDTQKPTGTYTVPACSNQNWLTANDPQLWNAMNWWDPVLEIHDLCEEPTDLCITATDACSGANVNIEYLLFLDLDGNGTMETVVNSTQLGNQPGGLGWNNVLYGNVTGAGESRQFDFRPVAANQKWGFAIQETVSGNNKTACVKFNTFAAQNSFVNPQLPHGNHKIKWIVSDGCGNENVYEYDVKVKDCKAPTVVCINGLSANIMPTGMITVWATDFLQYGEDNCTPVDQLKYSIRKAGTGTGFPTNPDGTPVQGVTFTCDELGTQPVELWAIDAAGNADFCLTYIIVQDNNGNCGPTAPMVAGQLKSEMQDGLENATVTLNGGGVTMTDVTDAVGSFQFQNMGLGNNYVVTPEKDDDHLNGVSTFDLVLMHKHILGIEPLNSPYKMIAADANKSKSITTFDMVEYRKLILGIYDELPGNTSWRFVDKNFVFPNPANPFESPFPENIDIVNFQSGMFGVDFVAIKTGDLNNSAVANFEQVADDRSAGTAWFEAADRSVNAGEIFEVSFKPAQKLEGYQFTMNFNGLEVMEILPGEGLTTANFAVFNDAMTASFERETAEFTLRFRAAVSGTLSRMLSAGDNITRAEAYGKEGERFDVNFRFSGNEGMTIAGSRFELLQNTPNPVSAVTRIAFNLPEASDATLTISTIDGRIVKQISGAFAKGFNSVEISRAELESGVLFYELKTADYSAARKMIVTE